MVLTIFHFGSKLALFDVLEKRHVSRTVYLSTLAAGLIEESPITTRSSAVRKSVKAVLHVYR